MTLLETIQLEFFVRFGFNVCSFDKTPPKELLKYLDVMYEKISPIIIEKKPYIGDISDQSFPLTISLIYCPIAKRTEIKAHHIGVNTIKLYLYGKQVYLLMRLRSTLAQEISCPQHLDYLNLEKYEYLDTAKMIADVVDANQSEFSPYLRKFAHCCKYLKSASDNLSYDVLRKEIGNVVDEKSAEENIKKTCAYRDYETFANELKEIRGKETLICDELKSFIDCYDSEKELTPDRLLVIVQLLYNYLRDFELNLFRNAANIAYESAMLMMENFD